MTCNTISLVSRLIWKRCRWKFIDIFEDVCSLRSCFSNFLLIHYASIWNVIGSHRKHAVHIQMRAFTAHVALVCVCVGHAGERCKNVWTDRDAVQRKQLTIYHCSYLLSVHRTIVGCVHWRQPRRGCRGHIPQYFGWGGRQREYPPNIITYFRI